VRARGRRAISNENDPGRQVRLAALTRPTKALPGISTPMRRIRSRCCACATTGHAAALPTLLIVAFGSEVGWLCRWRAKTIPDGRFASGRSLGRRSGCA
jgi:hypothetical protein